MTKRVSPGEPILPNMTAAWFNKTLEQQQKQPLPPVNDLRHHNETKATFVPTDDCAKALRFTAVAPMGNIDNIGNSIQRAQYVGKENLTKHNWIITQLEMGEGYATQDCVYAGITFAKVTIRSASHTRVDLDLTTLELVSSNSGKGVLINAQSPYSLISIESYQAPATTTSTSTSTTPPLNPPQECTGKCKYTSSDGISWSLAEDNCTPTTTSTTSTTTTSTSSTSEPTTTTTYDGVSRCRTSTTTSTTSPGNDPGQQECDCLPPVICPTAPGQCTFTACALIGENQEYEQPYCSSTTSTTSSTSSSTTTTCDCSNLPSTTRDPSCGPRGECEWVAGPNGTVVNTSNPCGLDCYCNPPNNPECGIIESTPCICGGTTPDTPPCPKECYGIHCWTCIHGAWFWGLCSGGTNRCEDACLQGNEVCSFNPPPLPCENCETQYTSCRLYSITTAMPPSTTTTRDPCDTSLRPEDGCYFTCSGLSTTTAPTTSTTTTVDPCAGPCKRQWFTDFGTPRWVVIEDKCLGNCSCGTINRDGVDTCEVVAVGCVGIPPTSTSTSTTTTTTTTSTSTTTTACCQSQCLPENLPANGCRLCCSESGMPPSGVMCCNCDPGYEPVTLADIPFYVCGGVGCGGVSCKPITTTTSTTTSTSTTTTGGPGACCIPGACIGGQVLSGCTELGGTWQGTGTVCSPDPCPTTTSTSTSTSSSTTSSTSSSTTSSAGP